MLYRRPSVLGFFAPQIYLPAGLSDSARQHVILHEQTHIRRFDHVIKLVAYATLCLHWFNPLVWFAFKLMCKDMEMSCDEYVLKKMGIEETKKEYSMLLVAFATGVSFIGSSPLAFGENSIKERIKNVLNLKKRSRFVSLAAIMPVVVLSIGLMINPIRIDAIDYIIQTEHATRDASASESRTESIPIENLPTAPPTSENLSVDDNTVSFVDGIFEFHVPFIPLGDVIMVGRVDFEIGQQYRVFLEAAEGQGVFFGISNRPNIGRNRVNISWRPFSSGASIGPMTVTQNYDDSFRYMYIGSNTAFSFATDLTDVTLRLICLTLDASLAMSESLNIFEGTN